VNNEKKGDMGGWEEVLLNIVTLSKECPPKAHYFLFKEVFFFNN